MTRSCLVQDFRFGRPNSMDYPVGRFGRPNSMEYPVGHPCQDYFRVSMFNCEVPVSFDALTVVENLVQSRVIIYYL